jgi:hypothetical protein
MLGGKSFVRFLLFPHHYPRRWLLLGSRSRDGGCREGCVEPARRGRRLVPEVGGDIRDGGALVHLPSRKGVPVAPRTVGGDSCFLAGLLNGPVQPRLAESPPGPNALGDGYDVRLDSGQVRPPGLVAEHENGVTSLVRLDETLASEAQKFRHMPPDIMKEHDEVGPNAVR